MSSKQASSSGKVPALVKPSNENSAQETQITGQMNSWLNSLYKYYAERESSATVSQTMQKVIVHLDAISQHLRAIYPPGSSFSVSPNGGSQSSDAQLVMKTEAKSDTKEDAQAVKEPEKQQLVDYSISSESLSKTISPAPVVIFSGSDKSSKPATEDANKSSAKSADSSLPNTTNQKPGSSSGNLDPTCGICLEEVNGRSYGLLEQCAHPFCEPCMRSLLEHNGSGREAIKCPTCRTLSARIIIRETFLANGPMKTALFDSLICCPPHIISNAHSEEEDEDLAVQEDEVFNLVPDMHEMLTVNDSDDSNVISITTMTVSDEVDSEENSSDNEGHAESIIFDSTMSHGPGHPINLSIEITGRTSVNAIYAEDSDEDLHLLWSPDEVQVEDAVEASSDEDVSTSNEEADDHFGF